MPDHVPIEVPDHSRFQKWEWRIQRVAWSLGVVMLLAAFLGLLGPGSLTRCRRSNSDQSLTLQFDRFARHHCPGLIDCEIQTIQNRFELELSNSFLREVRIERIEPPPLRIKLAKECLQYVFEKTDGKGVVRIQLHVNYEHFGEVAGAIGLGTHEPVAIKQFVYP